MNRTNFRAAPVALGDIRIVYNGHDHTLQSRVSLDNNLPGFINVQ